ncbi:MAG: hypothetical protein H6828_15035 [Planctomycetes bacterium]|nr:hypothetical protein [Planctomycetota bacterium]
MSAHRWLLVALAACPPLAAPAGDTARDAAAYAEAIEALNADHAKKPGKATEADLAKAFAKDKPAHKAFERVLASDDLAALERCADAALELALVDDFDAARARRAKLAPDDAAALPHALARERFLLVGEGGLGEDYLAHFAEVLDDVLDAYDEVFGFAELSKVPGKKLRVRLRLVEAITSPPHFAPEFAWHSEIDFPVVDAERFRSPTAQGQFLFYGLCHELGHVVAMWGPGPTRGDDEDHHAWAHYTGLRVLQHFADAKGKRPEWLADARDHQWRDYAKEVADKAAVEPGLADRDAVLALLFRLDALVGPRALGDAINALDAADERPRVNRVRYYSFDALGRALVKLEKDKSTRKQLEALLP